MAFTFRTQRYDKPESVPIDFNTPNHPVLRKIAKDRFSSKRRERLYRRLADPLRAGHSPEQALGMMYRRERFKGYRRAETVVLRSLLYRLKSGGDITSGLSEFVPVNEQLAVRAGETHGNLAEAFYSASRSISAIRDMRYALIKAVTIPVAVTLIMMAGLYGTGAYLMPILARSMDLSSVSGLALIVTTAGAFATSIWFPILGAAMFALAVCVVLSYPRWKSRLRSRADKTPLYAFYRIMLASSWLTTLSALLSAGSGVNESLRQLYMIALEQKNVYLASRTEAIIAANKAGAINVGAAMEAARHDFPDSELIGDIVMRATLKDFERQLHHLAFEWVEEKVKEVHRISAVLGFVGLFVMFLAMCLVMLSFYSLFSQFQASTGI